LGKQGAEGMVHILFADPANKDYQALAAFYQKKYNNPPNELIVNFYDGAAIMLKAIQAGGDPAHPQKAREAMPKLFPVTSLQGQRLTYGGKQSIGVDAQVFSTNYIAVMKDGKSVVVGEAK
jgi:branched-chain amino acid transport system substrate-binding protein